MTQAAGEQGARNRLADKACFLEYDGHRYRFKTEPSINKIIADETVQVGPSKAKLEIEGRIRQILEAALFQSRRLPGRSGRCGRRCRPA